MRILFIKQLFNPEPTAKALDFALELKKNGHEVQVLTGFPSYPLGRIYEGYRQKLWSRENIKGIEVIRVPIFPDHSQSGWRRMLYYISYAISASILGPFLTKKADVAFVYQGAIPVGLPAYIFKLFKQTPFLYDINDLWPETVKVSGMVQNKRMLNLIRRWCKFNYNNASFITVATPGFKKKLIEAGIPPSKIDVVSNWCRDADAVSELESDKVNQHFPSSCFNILYAGNLGILQSLQTILDAAAEYQSQGIKDIRFIFMGAGNDENRLRRFADDNHLSNVSFLPRVSSQEVSKYLLAADVLLVHLKNTPLFEITIPSKVLSYLKNGKPILLGVKGDTEKLIQESGAGRIFEPENISDFMKQVNELKKLTKDELAEMGRRGKEYYRAKLSIENSTRQLISHFERIKNG